MPEQKATLDKILAQVAAAAKAQNYTTGLAQLDQLEAALQAARPSAAAKPAASAEEAAADAELAAEFEALLKTLRPRLTRLLDLVRRSDPATAGELDALYTRALGEHQAERHAPAYDLLTSLDARVTALMRTAQAAAEVRKAAGPQNVAFVTSKLEWDRVRQTARAELTKFQQTVLSDPETQADPRFADSIVPAVNGLGKVLDDFDDRLNTALDEAAALAADQKGPAIRKALDLIVGYRGTIAGSEIIAAVDSGVYGSVNVGGSLTAALDTMAARLQKA